MIVNRESEVYDAIMEKDISQHRQLELVVDVNFKRSCVNQHEELLTATTSRRHAQLRHCVIPIHIYFREIYTAGSGGWGQTSQAPTAYEIKLNS